MPGLSEPDYKRRVSPWAWKCDCDGENKHPLSQRECQLCGVQRTDPFDVQKAVPQITQKDREELKKQITGEQSVVTGNIYSAGKVPPDTLKTFLDKVQKMCKKYLCADPKCRTTLCTMLRELDSMAKVIESKL